MFGPADLLWPVTGFKHIALRPRLWPGIVMGSLGGPVLVTAAAVILAWVYWPEDVTPSAVVKLAFNIVAGLAVFLAVMLPFLKGKAGQAVLRPILAAHGIEIEGNGKARTFKQQMVYLLRTLPWRIVWIVVVVWAANRDADLAKIVALWAIGRLMVLDACDQVLTIIGMPFGKRRWNLAKHGVPMVLAGLVAGIAAVISLITVFGWMLWAPGVFAGACGYVLRWSQVQEFVGIDETGTPLANNVQADSSASQAN